MTLQQEVEQRKSTKELPIPRYNDKLEQLRQFVCKNKFGATHLVLILASSKF